MQVGDLVITTGGKSFRVCGIYQDSEGTPSVGLHALDSSSVEIHIVPRSLIVEAGAVYRRVQ